jgi:hypothetical protein
VQWPFSEFSPWQTVAADGFYVIDITAGMAAWKAP